MGLASAAMIAGWLTVTAVAGGGGEAPTEAELTHMAAQVQALKANDPAAPGVTASRAERIEARQRFLDALINGRANDGGLAELLPPEGASEDAPANGVLAPFAALERKQNILLQKVAAGAETRLRDAEGLIGRLGLVPDNLLRKPDARRGETNGANGAPTGMGGPYVPAGEDSRADPHFAELYANLQRAEQLESAITSLPSFVPVSSYRLSSSFGNRKDPFNGGRARHTGLDMAGTRGQPIYAAGGGKVVRAGRFSGYGNCVDIDHGNGVVTRYGHLATIGVKVGQQVAMGERIAAMGSTGRSTGTHLHYEVLINSRPVNPRPFVEASSYLLAFAKDNADTGGSDTGAAAEVASVQ